MKEELKSQVNAKLDEEFVYYMLQIESRYASFNKHEKIRIEQWVRPRLIQAKKLCQVTANVVWKKNRNLYAMLLLDMVLKERLQQPFASIPPEASIPVLSFHQVKAKLSRKFFELKRDQKTDLKAKLNELDQLPTEYRSPEGGSPRGSPLHCQIRRMGSPHRPKALSPAFQFHSHDPHNESLYETEPKRTHVKNKSITMGKIPKRPTTASRTRSKSPNVNRIIDKVRKKIGQQKGIDTSFSLEKPHLSDLRGVATSRNSLVDSSTSNLRRDAETSRSKVKTKFGKKVSSGSLRKPEALHSEPGHQQQQFLSTSDFTSHVGGAGDDLLRDFKAMKAENTRLKTENQVHSISIKHLKSDLEYKENQLAKQTMEIAQLLSQMAELKHENQRLRERVSATPPPLMTREDSKGEQDYLCFQGQSDLSLSKMFQRSQQREPGSTTSVRSGLMQQQSFYQYLQDFQRETEKLNKETEDVLKGTKKLRRVAADTPPQRELVRGHHNNQEEL